ncbi:STAS domain-containing protein [Nocardioides caricicola]
MIVVERRDDTAVVRCAGEVDLATVGALRAKLQEIQVDGPSRLVLVLDEVTFMDSLGLGALIGAYKRARVLQTSMVLVCTSRPVLNVLRATSLDRVFRIHDDLDDALAGELV